MLKGATLCSGIGAPECAAPDIDWIWSSDIEPFPNAVRAVRFPDSINLGDMTAEDFVARAAAIGLPDVLVAGTPCQAFSVAGLRQSLADDRGNLTLLFVRICDAVDDLRRAAGLDPLWIVWENVPGVLSVKDNAFGSLLAGLGGHDAPITPIGRGRWSNAGVVAGPKRGVAWRILDAQHFGVAQRRRRIFIVARGGAGNWNCADALLPLIDSLQRHPAPSRKAREEIARGSEISVGKDDLNIVGALTAKGPAANGAPEVDGGHYIVTHAPDIANSLGASPACGTSVNVANGQGPVIAVDTYNASVGDVAPALCTQGDHASGNGAVMLHPAQASVAMAITVSASGATVGDIAATLDCASVSGRGSAQQQAVLSFHPTQDPISSADISHALGTGSAGGQASVAVAFSPEIARSLTARHDGSPCADRGPNIVAVPTWPADIAPTLDAGHANTQGIDDQHVNSGAGLFVPTAFQSSQSGVRTGELHATLDSNNGSRRHNGVISQSAVRRLTPRECERLQGFPDDWTAITIKGKPAADAPRYKALGNSMAVPVMRYILDRVKEVNDA